MTQPLLMGQQVLWMPLLKMQLLNRMRHVYAQASPLFCKICGLQGSVQVA
jgi:hypothetical protein